MIRPRLLVRTMLVLIAASALVMWVVRDWLDVIRTEYAPDYDEARFHQVAIGDGRAQVEARLGKPLRVTYGGSVVGPGGRIFADTVRYEHARSPRHYDDELRDVWFDRSNRVMVVYAMHHND